MNESNGLKTKRGLKKLREIDIGMPTTVDEDGTLRCSPMSTNGAPEANCDLRMFTYRNMHKVAEIDSEVGRPRLSP
jgi:general stress protein 26